MIKNLEIENSNKLYKYLLMAGMIFIPALLFLLPSNFLDNRETICLFTKITGYHCMGCGITRACFSIIHFDFLKAWNLNKLSIIIFPILLYGYTQTFYQQLKSLKEN